MVNRQQQISPLQLSRWMCAVRLFILSYMWKIFVLYKQRTDCGTHQRRRHFSRGIPKADMWQEMFVRRTFDPSACRGSSGSPGHGRRCSCNSQSRASFAYLAWDANPLRDVSMQSSLEGDGHIHSACFDWGGKVLKGPMALFLSRIFFIFELEFSLQTSVVLKR